MLFLALSPVQKVQLFWERGHLARGWLRKIRKMRAGCPRSQKIPTWHSIAMAFYTGIKLKGFFFPQP
jgi:hypothetical protein